MMTMLKLMHEREEIRVVTDEVGTPTWAKTLARAVWLAEEQKALHGIYHWTDGGVASRYEFAAAIQEEALALGLLARPIRIRPIRTAEYPIAARRPAYTVLDKAATIADFGLTPPLAYYPTPDACRVSPCVDCSSRAAQVSSEQTSSITGSDNIVTISL